MNSKWHLYTSVAKSIIRIIGCVAVGTWGVKGLYIMATCFFFAETLGIMEEFGDER